MQRFVNLIIRALILSMLCSSAIAGNKDPVDGLVKSDAVQAKLNSSPVFTGRGDGVTTCPVTGTKVNKKSLRAQFYGRTVYLCCHGCLKAAKKTPDKFIKPTQVEQDKAVKDYLAKAKPVKTAEFCDD